MIHILKCWPSHFFGVWEGVKPFEIRKNDRDFRPFDLVMLKEWDPNPISVGGPEKGYTGRRILARISCVSSFEQKPGFVVFGLEKTRNLEKREF